MRGQSILLSLLLFTQACGVHYLAPTELPERAPPPPVAAPRPAGPGEGQVTLDVLGAPARVDRVVARNQVDGSAWPQGSAGTGRGYYGPSVQTVPLCIAPCAVTLPVGDHELLFSALDPSSDRSSTAFVHVGPEPVLVRHSLGTRRDHVGRILAAALLGGLGAGTLMAGTVLLGVNSSQSTNPALRANRTDLGPAGWTLLGTGAIAAVAAIWLGLESGSEVQPGSTAVFPMDRP